MQANWNLDLYVKEGYSLLSEEFLQSAGELPDYAVPIGLRRPWSPQF